MRINISTQQIQRQLLAPAMQQSIEMLMLPLTELTLSINQEIQDNPLLEVDEEELKSAQEQSRDEILKNFEYSNQIQSSSFREHSADDEILEDRAIKMEICLEDELLQQLRIELSDPLEIKISEIIIGSLNEDGYLTVTCEEIAESAGTDNLARVEYILKIIQNSEPIGIASRDLKECLLCQVNIRCNGNSELIRGIIENHLEDLGRKKFQKIAKTMKIPLDTIREAARFIALFEPKPARNYRPIKTGTYIKPDIFITKDENEQYNIQINKAGVPPLRVNTKYQRMLRQNNLSDSEKEFIREKLKNALYFIKSVEQRGQTICKISEYILEKQKDFFENGHRSLVPMTLKDIAQTIDRNESTISRAVANKYADTPQGILPLKFFFSQGIPENGNGLITSRSIKEDIKELIKSEDGASPFSDQAIQDHFKQKGTTIARRTISKYRQALRILPSHLRKN